MNQTFDLYITILHYFIKSFKKKKIFQISLRFKNNPKRYKDINKIINQPKKRSKSCLQQMSTAKKYARRKQKKQFLDEQDLQNQQALEELKKFTNQTDIFSAAKLQENYFIRSQIKNIQIQQNHTDDIQFEEKVAISNIQYKDTVQISKKQIISDKNDEEMKQKNQRDHQNKEKKNKNITDKKRRRKPGKNKKQAIFDDESDQNEQQQQQDQKYSDTQQQQKKQSHLFKLQKIQKINMNQQNLQESLSQSGISNGQDDKKSEKKDDFDMMIKDQQEQQQSQEEIILHLHQLLNSLSKEQRKQYFYQPLKQGEVAIGYFKRVSSGLSEVYQFLGQDYRPIMFCENQRGCIGCNYYISLTKQMDKNKPTYLGKLRGNATGSIYNLYDCGMQPKNQMNRSKWRISMAAIEYESNFMGFNGPRKLKVTIPSPKHFQDPDTFKLSQEESILSFKPPVIAQFRNKTPKWNQKLKSYALNFGGRVKLASIKNFILISNEFQVEEQDEADNVIIFGKVDDSTFSVEYRYPLSLFQAFGIIMSEFDFKLNCQ